jgi:hemerythrin
MYSVKVASLDRQHEKLFRIVDELHEALGRAQGKTVVDGSLKKLIDYTMIHFTAEEALLRNTAYPELSAHVAEHCKLRSRIEALREQYAKGDRDVPGRLMTFLLDWLKTHILNEDKKYGAFLNGKGFQ